MHTESSEYSYYETSRDSPGPGTPPIIPVRPWFSGIPHTL